jgi:hypothetical protein
VPAGDEIFLDRGEASPEEFLTQYGHVPNDAVLRSSLSMEPQFSGAADSELHRAKVHAYTTLFGGKPCVWFFFDTLAFLKKNANFLRFFLIKIIQDPRDAEHLWAPGNLCAGVL